MNYEKGATDSHKNYKMGVNDSHQQDDLMKSHSVMGPDSS